MKSEAGKRILSFALAAALLLGVCVTNGPMATTAYAAPQGTEGDPSDGIDFDALIGEGIYYGTYDHAASLSYTTWGTVATRENVERPILWQIMGNDGSNVVALSEYVLDSQVFHSGQNAYESSAIKAWLENSFATSGNFPDAEGSFALPTTVTTRLYNYSNGDPVQQASAWGGSTYDADGIATEPAPTAQQFYLPWGTYGYATWADSNHNKVGWDSEADKTSTNVLGTKEAKLKSGTGGNVEYWLRSPYSAYSDIALYVNADGYVGAGNVGISLGVRPAFQFNPSSVIFSSEILGDVTDKPWATAADSNYSAAAGGGANYKLTIVNDGLTLSGVTADSETVDATNHPTVTTTPGGAVSIAGTGDSGTKLTYKIVKSNSGTREIVGYGQDAGNTSLTVNAADLDGADLAVGTYTVYVWAQQDNDKNSNEGSEPMYFTLGVEDATPGPGLPTASPGDLYDGIDFDALIGEGIYYGIYNHATSLQDTEYGTATKEGTDRPILWRVMGEENGNGKLTFLSEYVLDSTAFHASSNIYNNSTVKDILGTMASGMFSTGETPYAVSTDVTTRMYDRSNGNELTGSQQSTTYPVTTDDQTLYLPWGKYNDDSVYWDAGNTENTDYKLSASYSGNAASLKSGTNVYMWLRSPDSDSSIGALSVDTDGDVDLVGVGTALGVRPAFQFNPLSVIFSSEIADVAVEANGETQSDGNYSSIAAGGGANYKLTVVNSSLTLGSLTGPNSQALTGNGQTLTVTSGGSLALTGSIGGGADKLVYKIVDRSTGKIVGYGIGNDTTLTVNGIANMTTGGGALSTTGDYTLYVWAQQDYDKNSNEGSTPMYFTLDVQAQDTAAPTVTAYSPLYGADNVSTGASLTLTFNKNITAVSGKYITIHNDTDGTDDTVEATDAQVAVTNNIVTITPASGLEPGKSYYVTIDAGAFKDSADNDYAGISDAVTWAFSTADAAQGVSLSLDYMADDTATEGEPYYKTIPVTYTNGTGTLGYSISGEPSGLSVVSLGSSGAITGTPDSGTEANSPYTITVTVTDSMGASDSRSYTLTVEAAPGSGATLDIATPTDATATVGEPFVKTLSVTYINGTGALTYSASGLPPGLDIDTDTGKISGTPTQDGDYNVTVEVTDGMLSDDADFTIEVLPGQQPPQPPVTYYTVTYSAGTGGSVSSGHVSGNQVTSGSAITITASANRNYSFTGWTVNGGGGGSNNPGTFTIMQDTNIAANFTYTGGNNDSGGSSSDSSSSTTTTVSGSITINSIKTSYSATGGVLTSNISAANLRSIVDNAYKNEDGGRIVKISYNGVSSSASLNSLTLTFDASKLGADEDVTFIIETPYGVLIYTTGQMLQWFEGGFGTYTITLEKSSLKVNIKKDGKSVSWNALTPMARIGVAYTLKTGESTANLAVTDKNGRVMPTSVYEKGMVYADIFAPGTYKAESITPTAYTDITGHWAKDDINYATLRGLIDRTSATTYSPDTPITRADYLMALGKLAGANVNGYKQSSFTDVSSDSPYMPYIEWAVKNKIVQGVGDNKFAPDANITREEMALMMANYAKTLGYTLPTANSAAAYSDSGNISGWAKDAVTAMQKAGTMTGRDGNIFAPQGSTTRGEAASILRRFVEQAISSNDAEGWSNDNVSTAKRVYYNQNGNRLTGWRTIGGSKYNFGSDGLMRTGWQTIDDKRYYFYASGKMIAGQWAEIGGKWYYFHTDGTLAVDTKIDGYEVGADGARRK